VVMNECNLIRCMGRLQSIETERNGIRRSWCRLPKEQGRQGDQKAAVACSGNVDSERRRNITRWGLMGGKINNNDEKN
jgi:predicted PP-loop superfamily ATPase